MCSRTSCKAYLSARDELLTPPWRTPWVLRANLLSTPVGATAPGAPVTPSAAKKAREQSSKSAQCEPDTARTAIPNSKSPGPRSNGNAICITIRPRQAIDTKESAAIRLSIHRLFELGNRQVRCDGVLGQRTPHPGLWLCVLGLDVARV